MDAESLLREADASLYRAKEAKAQKAAQQAAQQSTLQTPAGT